MKKSDLAALLGPGGKLAEVLPGYEPRAPQLEMAEHVASALAEGRALVVEAGTGTGKTLAYLVPAAKSGLRVIISTATKNLQEQLRDKDVPMLRRLGVDAKVAFLKGRQNYLCLLRKEQFDRAPTFTTREEASLLAKIDAWAEKTETGDRSELEDVPENAPVLSQINSTADTCTGPKCAHYDNCFVFKMRRRAGDADVVVVNHHLFFADLKLRSTAAGDSGGAAVLPKYDAVIFDEAHAIEEVAIEHFGSQVSSRRVQDLSRDTLAALATRGTMAAARDLAARLGREGADFFQAALALHESVQAQLGPDARLGAGAGSRGRPSSGGSSRSSSRGGGFGAAPRPSSTRPEGERWTVTHRALVPAESERQGLNDLLRSLSASLNAGGEAPDEEVALLERRCVELIGDLELFAPEAEAPADRAAGNESERGEPGDLESAAARARRGSALADERPRFVSKVHEVKPALPELVRWAEHRGGHIALHASPLDVARLLQDRLYDRIGPVVFTSATLAVAGSLEYFARAVGLTDAQGPLYPIDQALLASPFDYAARAALYLPRAIPDPIDPRFPEAVADELRQLLPITGGRAFALFTSLRNMRAVHGLLEKELRASGLGVLLQGEASKQQLLRSFKEQPSVLFASQSFWEGVDVPGDALSLVIIDKLPFASPQEPLTAARIERLRAQGDDPFSTWQVPQAALALKQGFGRLIRSASDRGIVALLDARLTTRSYGRTFISTLPKCRVLRSAGEVEEFWRGE